MRGSWAKMGSTDSLPKAEDGVGLHKLVTWGRFM